MTSCLESNPSNSIHDRAPPSAIHSMMGNSGAISLFNNAVKPIIASGDRPSVTQASTSKLMHKIKGLAAKTGSILVEGKGKAKANTPVGSAHIDLTEESEEDEDQLSSQSNHQSRKAPEEIIDDVVNGYTATENDPSNDLSDDPMRLTPPTKRMNAMQGKDNKKTTKPTPGPLSTNEKNSISTQPTPYHLKLRRIRTFNSQIVFDKLGNSCDVWLKITDSELSFEIKPTPISMKLKLRAIKAAYHYPRDPYCSDLILELNSTYRIEQIFKPFLNLFTPLKRVPFVNAFHLEVLDASFNSTVKEMIDAMGTCQVQCHENENTNKFRLLLRRTCSAENDDHEPDEEPESYSSRRPRANSSDQSSPSPLSPVESSINNTSSHAIKKMPILSTAIYNKSESTQTSHPRLQNHTASRLVGFKPQTTMSPNQDQKPPNLENKILLDRLKGPASKVIPKKTDARQDLQDGLVAARVNTSHQKTDAKQESPNVQATPRYNTRHSLSRSSIQRPIDPPSQLPREQSITGPDGDIALIWPFEGDCASRSVAITNGDMKRLADGEFLNDTLIEFGLKWELSQIEKRSPELVASIHLFNSFFFQKLSGCKSKEKTAAGEAEAYAGVRKWTKGIDIFKKDFLVIPINEHMHWYFMIVLNPGKLLDPQIHVPETNSQTSCTPMRTRLTHRSENSVTKQLSPTTPESQDGLTTSPFFTSRDETSTTNFTSAKQATTAGRALANDLPTNVNVAVNNSAQALQDMELDDEKSFAQEGGTNPECSTTDPIDDMELPYVFTLDSLGTPHRPQSTTILRYLINEAKDKLKTTLPESLAKSVCIKKVAVPEQPNFCDCGLYLIHAFKTFFSKPQPMLRWILDYNSKKGQKEQRQSDICEVWNAAGAAQARQALRNQLWDLIPQYKEIAALRKANAEKKKEQARIRKLSCADEPRASNHDSAKKPRLSYSEPSGQISTIVSPNPVSCVESLVRPTPKPLLEESSSSDSEIDVSFTKASNKKSKTANSTSPSTAQGQSIDAVADQPDIIPDPFRGAILTKNDTLQGPSPGATSTKEDAMMHVADSRSVTPDISLMLQTFSPLGGHTPECSPSHNQKAEGCTTDTHGQPTVGPRVEFRMDFLQSPEATTPPEEDQNYDGEALPPDVNHSSDDSSLTEIESSVHCVPPRQPPPRHPLPGNSSEMKTPRPIQLACLSAARVSILLVSRKVSGIKNASERPPTTKTTSKTSAKILSPTTTAISLTAVKATTKTTASPPFLIPTAAAKTISPTTSPPAGLTTALSRMVEIQTILLWSMMTDRKRTVEKIL